MCRLKHGGCAGSRAADVEAQAQRIRRLKGNVDALAQRKQRLERGALARGGSSASLPE